MNTDNSNKKINIDSKKLICAIGAVAGLLVIILIIKPFFLGNKSNDKTVYNPDFNLRESATFFIKDNEKELYALYNSDGKKLTDFDYKNSNTEFYNHAMLVENTDGKYGVINDSGKIIIKFGEYDNITRVSSLFLAEKGDKRFIINNKGKVVKKFDHEVVYNYFSTFNEFTIIRDDNKYYVIDFEGDIVYTFNKENNDTFPTASYKEGILSVFYNNENYIINIKTNKMLLKVSEEQQLCVSSTDEKGNSFVLNTCSSLYSSGTKKRYIVVNKNKITYDIDNTDECDSVSYVGKVLRCTKDNKSFFIYVKGKKVYDDVDVNEAAYVTNKDFAVNNEKKVDFYKNGKKVNSVDGSLSNIGVRKEKKYVLIVNDGYQLYNENGKQIGDNTYKKILTNYDEHYYGKIDINKYVFILDNGKESQEFYKISNGVDKYYKVKLNEDTYAVADSSTGKVIVDESKGNFKIAKKGKKFIATTNYDDETIVYNLETGKKLISTKDEVTLATYYFKVLSDNKVQYYTYTDGKMFLERNN